VSNTKAAGAIVGKINADPNPIPFGQGCVLISWETNDPAGAEVRVSTSAAEEKVVSQGRSGQTEIRWIVRSTAYDFRLYAASQPTAPIDSVEVRRDFRGCAGNFPRAFILGNALLAAPMLWWLIVCFATFSRG
jgi:hypothetical protein